LVVRHRLPFREWVVGRRLPFREWNFGHRFPFREWLVGRRLPFKESVVGRRLPFREWVDAETGYRSTNIQYRSTGILLILAVVEIRFTLKKK